MKRLTAVVVRNLGPGRHADGGGLYLEVDPSGARRWLLRTLVHGRRRDLGLGPTSLVPLAEAREKATELRKAARDGRDPIAERDRHKRRSPSFEEAARHVYATRIVPATDRPEGMKQWLGRLERYAFPAIGRMPVHAIGQADLLRVLEPIWLVYPEAARRVRQRMSVVFDWARTAGHVSGVNPVDGIEAGLPRQRDKVEHHAALPWRDLPALWPRLEAVEGMGAMALRFAILTAARSGEVRDATWDEVDFGAALWTIPAARMKSQREHRVPLSPAALEILAAVRGLDARLVFPSRRGGGPLRPSTVVGVLKRLKVDAVPQGFRSSFRDWCEEAASYSHEAKELALAHAVKNRVEAAYRRGDLLEQRRPMMSAWGRFVTGGGAAVVRLAHA